MLLDTSPRPAVAACAPENPAMSAGRFVGAGRAARRAVRTRTIGARCMRIFDVN